MIFLMVMMVMMVISNGVFLMVDGYDGGKNMVVIMVDGYVDGYDGVF